MAEPHHPLVELTLARLREFWREPSALFWTFGFPVLLAVGLGIAFRHRPAQPIDVAVTGGSPDADRVAAILDADAEVAAERCSSSEAGQRLGQGKVALVVDVRPARDEPRLVYRFDPMRDESRTARLLVDAVVQRGLGRADVAASADELWSEPGGRYIDFLIPGLVGLNLMGSSMWGIGYAIALTRKRRLLRRLAATPMRRSHYLLSFMLSRIVFLGAEVGVLLAVGSLLFDVQVRGSLAGVLLLSVTGALSFMGVALLVASRTDNTEVASGLMNAVMLPMWLLSGSFFSYERFPETFHPFIRLLPLTAFNDALRAVMNEGAPIWQTWPQLTVLAVLGAATFALALRVFRWQ